MNEYDYWDAELTYPKQTKKEIIQEQAISITKTILLIAALIIGAYFLWQYIQPMHCEMFDLSFGQCIQTLW